MANWFTNQKAKRELGKMPLMEDMTGSGGAHNQNKGYGDSDGPPMHDGPKNYDTDKGSHAHPHDGPKKYDKVVLGGNKGDKSKTKKGKKDYGG